MPRRRHLVALTCAALLALPGTASAGGAGDDQYQDPFAEPQGSTPAQTQTQEPPAAPQAPAAESQAAPAPAQDATAAAALPRTGADAGIAALGGGALLLAGLALRRRTADGARA